MKQIRIIALLLVSFLLLAFFVGCKSTAFTSAKLYLQQENYEKAEEFLKKEIAQNPSNAEAHYLLGRLYARDGRFEGMNKQFKASLKISDEYKKDINQVRKKYWIDNFNNGVRRLKNNQPSESVEAFKKAALVDPDAADTYKNMAYAYVLLDSSKAAIATYKKALELDPKDVKTMNALGQQYFNTEAYQKCVDTMKELLKIDPNNEQAISTMALAYDSMGESDKAIEAYDNALNKNPNNPDLHFNRGRLYYFREDYKKAIEDFKKVVEASPDDFVALHNLGNAYLAIAEQKKKAMYKLEEQKADTASVNEVKSEALDYYEKAKNFLEKARDIEPENVNVWNNLGVAYINLGMSEKGKAAFDKVDELEGKK